MRKRADPSKPVAAPTPKKPKKTRNAQGQLENVKIAGAATQEQKYQWPLKFPYETGGSYAEKMNEHQLRKAKYDAGDKSGPPPDPFYLRAQEDVAMVLHPTYTSWSGRWLGAKARGNSYEFFIFPSYRSFIERVLADTHKKQCNWFAIVEEKRPVKFYMDIDESCARKGTLEQFFRERALVALAFVRVCLEGLYGVDLGRRNPKERWLAACNDSKSSFHAHVSEWTFEDVDALCDAMGYARACLDALRKISPDHPIVLALLSATPNEVNPWIIDWTVYTPRRKFRMALQSKKIPTGKPDWNPKDFRPLLPWDPVECKPLEHFDTEEWLNASAIVVRSGAHRRVLLPSPQIATKLHQSIYELCCNTVEIKSYPLLVWQAMQLVRLAYYDSELAQQDFETLKRDLRRLPEKQIRSRREAWNAAVCLLWDSGSARYEGNVQPLVRIDVLQPGTVTPLHIASSYDEEPIFWMKHLYGLVPWWNEPTTDVHYEIDPLRDQPAARIHAHRTICMRLAYLYVTPFRPARPSSTECLLRRYPVASYGYVLRKRSDDEQGCYSDGEYDYTRPQLRKEIAVAYQHTQEDDDDVDWSNDRRAYESGPWRDLANRWWSEWTHVFLDAQITATVPVVKETPTQVVKSRPTLATTPGKWLLKKMSSDSWFDDESHIRAELVQYSSAPSATRDLFDSKDKLQLLVLPSSLSFYIGTTKDRLWRRYIPTPSLFASKLSSSTTSSAALSPSGSDTAVSK